MYTNNKYNNSNNIMHVASDLFDPRSTISMRTSVDSIGSHRQIHYIKMYIVILYLSNFTSARIQYRNIINIIIVTWKIIVIGPREHRNIF